MVMAKGTYQDISQIEKWYIGKWSPNMFADYCWTLYKLEELRDTRKRIECLVNFLARMQYIETLFIIWYLIL
jgi:hypothetical protein